MPRKKNIYLTIFKWSFTKKWTQEELDKDPSILDRVEDCLIYISDYEKYYEAHFEDSSYIRDLAKHDNMVSCYGCWGPFTPKEIEELKSKKLFIDEDLREYESEIWYDYYY